ncbi:MAG: LPS export ABC transporter ATP-binding protein [Verrucomicrobia bacterium]|nr:LPS export ABC transporter ATP-binding protein [Verrucomicrobiota bacterium]
MAPTRLGLESPVIETRRHIEKPILRTEKLVKIYGGRSVVNGIDIHVNKGEIVGLLGPNGAGKTTTFYLIVGLVRPNGGRVYFQDRNVTGFAMHRRARMGMGYLPQEESIFRKLTVEQNILAILETLRVSRRERRRRCSELLRQFGIDNLAKNQALTLSGGEKRRLTIARSLVTNPTLMMLDEPFSGVDPIAVSEIQQHISNLRKSGLAILITDHNVRETLEIGPAVHPIQRQAIIAPAILPDLSANNRSALSGIQQEMYPCRLERDSWLGLEVLAAGNIVL